MLPTLWPRLSFATALALSAAGASAQESPRVPDFRYIALPVVTFHSHNTEETLAVRLYRPDGSVDPGTLQSLSHFLRDPTTDIDAPVVPRTLQLLIRVANHFNATRVDIVSAFRCSRDPQGKVLRRGYHGEGSAIDFSFPDIPMIDVAAYARTLSHVGVGWYPTRNFMHLDSRELTYFWENHAGRGREGWDRPLDRVNVPRREAAWTPADDLPWDPPGRTVVVELHPRTAIEARLHRRPWTRRTHPHPPVTVFRGP